MKTRFWAIGIVAALSVSANAALITVENMDSDSVSISGFTVSSATVGNTVTYSFTQTGDLDGQANVDDTLSFQLISEFYTGSSFDGTDVTLGATQVTPQTDGNWENTFKAGNTYRWEVDNISYTDGEDDETLAFGGFTAINTIGYAGTAAGNYDFYVGLLGATTITGVPSFTADLTSGGTSSIVYFTGATDAVRLRDLDFQFETTAIPEPATLGLVVAAGVSALFIRRRWML